MATSTTDIDDLPDEILLMILGLVQDGVALLDGVSLVCKRWRRLALDPAVWAGIRLDIVGHKDPRVPGRIMNPTPFELCENSGDQRHITDAARVLLHAPAGAALAAVAMPRPPFFCWHEEQLASALRRTRVQVRELTRLDCCIRLEWASDTLRVLGPHLQVLEMTSGYPQHEALLAAMPALRRLSFMSHSKSEDALPELPPALEEVKVDFVTRGQALALHGLPSLRRLALHGCHHELEFPAPPAGGGLRWLSVSTTRGSTLRSLLLAQAQAGTLRELEVVCAPRPEGNSYYFADLADVVVSLRGLRRLVLQRTLEEFGSSLFHDAESCAAQLGAVRARLAQRYGADAADVSCSHC